LPGTFNNTKRFIKETRAAGASRSKDSLLRAVRYRENSLALCVHAACKTSRSAAAGLFAATGGAVVPSAFLTAGMLGKLAGLFDASPGLDEDSCARVCVANTVIIANTNAMNPNDIGKLFAKDMRENFIQAFAGLNISARFRVKLDRGITSSQPALLACSANSLCT
jgi:hypothetical protein